MTLLKIKCWIGLYNTYTFVGFTPPRLSVSTERLLSPHKLHSFFIFCLPCLLGCCNVCVYCSVNPKVYFLNFDLFILLIKHDLFRVIGKFVL